MCVLPTLQGSGLHVSLEILQKKSMLSHAGFAAPGLC
jgi:hypothetical protein